MVGTLNSMAGAGGAIATDLNMAPSVLEVPLAISEGSGRLNALSPSMVVVRIRWFGVG